MTERSLIACADIQEVITVKAFFGLRENRLPAHLNGIWLLQMLQSQRKGQSCLPFCLGMQPLELIVLLQSLWGVDLNLAFMTDTSTSANQTAWQRGQLRSELQEMRSDEWEEIRDLLLAHRSGDDSSEIYMAAVIAAGCLGGDHLWRDLGLPNRGELSRLMTTNFRPLAERNTQDMKWKKFFYKQLCEQEGGYVCRAPSCDQCAAYADCFGPEN